MNIRNVEIFCDIAAHRSFSKAALCRNISQPAVSQALQQLEEDLGVELVDRSQRPIDLTPAGMFYFQRCQKWLLEYREIEDAVQKHTGMVSGRLRVASIYSVGLLQMSFYVRKLRAEHPGVELTLDYARPDEIYSRLMRDEIEVGIVSFPKDGGDIGCIPWQRQEMVAAIGPGHRLAGLRQISIRDLDGENFIAFTADLTARQKTGKFLKDHDVSVNIVQQFDNVETIKRAVEIDLGVSILPLPTLRRELGFGTLSAAHFEDASFSRPLGIVHKRHKHLSRAAEKFVDLLHEEPREDSIGSASETASLAGSDT